MKLEIRLKAVYIIIILVCIVIMPTTISGYLNNIKIGTDIKGSLISSSTLIFVTVGLIFFGFALLIANRLWAYHVGKLFSLYLLVVSLCILLSNRSFRLEMTIQPTQILAIISNLILFYLIGWLTYLNYKKVFKICKRILVFFTFIQIMVTLFGGYLGLPMDFFINNVITINYIFTICIILIYLLFYYRYSTYYSQKQIRLFLLGLFLGIIIFIFVFMTPMLAIVKVTSNDLTYIYVDTLESLSAVDVNRDTLSIVMFTGIVGAITYIFIKREYLLEVHKELWKVLAGILYMILINIMMFYCFRKVNSMYIYMFNIIISLPLLLIYVKSGFDQAELYNHKLLKSLEDERQRISIFLHDEVLQDLIAILHTDETNYQISSLITAIRNLSHDLYPIIVDDLGLEHSLSLFIDELTIDYNIEINYDYQFPTGVIPHYIALVAYRSVKELVINAVKHSKCRKIIVNIHGDKNYLNIIIEDNGIGFIVKENSKLLNSPHMGLFTVKKQIKNLRGQLRLQSNIGTGTRYDISIPLIEE